MPWAGLIVGTVAALAAMRFHPILFGGNPLG
jgi:hypothetical protein